MNFHPSEEQRILAESVQRFMAERHAAPARRALPPDDEGFARAQWREMAALGWLGAGVPEALGGAGGGAAARMVLAEAFGRHLWSGPWLASMVLGAGLLAHAEAALREQLLPPLLAGELLVSVAYAEPQARHVLADVATRAQRAGEGYRLSGRKSFVLYAGSAGRLVVSARSSGERRDGTGIGLFVIDTHAPGVRMRVYPTVCGLRAAEVALDDVRVPAGHVLGDPAHGLALLEQACDQATAAVCAEAAGAMWFLYETTLAYLKTRHQFSRPLGAFQALQHRMVELYADCEMARSMAWVAAHGADADDPRERARAVSAAKCALAESGPRVAQEAVQLHGGMGMSDEMPVGHYFKRLTTLATLLGDAAFHRRRFVALASE